MTRLCPGCQRSLKVARNSSNKHHMITCTNWECRLYKSPLGYITKYLDDDKLSDEQLLGRARL